MGGACRDKAAGVGIQNKNKGHKQLLLNDGQQGGWDMQKTKQQGRWGIWRHK